MPTNDLRKRTHIGGFTVTGDPDGIAHLKKLDSTETHVLFTNCQEMGEAPFETYRGVPYLVRLNSDYPFVVLPRADDNRFV